MFRRIRTFFGTSVDPHGSTVTVESEAGRSSGAPTTNVYRRRRRPGSGSPRRTPPPGTARPGRSGTSTSNAPDDPARSRTRPRGCRGTTAPCRAPRRPVRADSQLGGDVLVVAVRKQARRAGRVHEHRLGCAAREGAGRGAAMTCRTPPPAPDRPGRLHGLGSNAAAQRTGVRTVAPRTRSHPVAARPREPSLGSSGTYTRTIRNPSGADWPAAGRPRIWLTDGRPARAPPSHANAVLIGCSAAPVVGGGLPLPGSGENLVVPQRVDRVEVRAVGVEREVACGREGAGQLDGIPRTEGVREDPVGGVGIRESDIERLTVGHESPRTGRRIDGRGNCRSGRCDERGRGTQGGRAAQDAADDRSRRHAHCNPHRRPSRYRGPRTDGA